MAFSVVKPSACKRYLAQVESRNAFFLMISCFLGYGQRSTAEILCLGDMSTLKYCSSQGAAVCCFASAVGSSLPQSETLFEEYPRLL
jgi:hypothetical protein